MADFLALRRQILNRCFARMNDRQRQAVFHVDGPLLILAGAGSGKTTVLVNRVANLIRFGRAYTSEEQPAVLSPEDWAALTAAANGTGEVDERVVQLCTVDPCPAWKILAITFTNKAAGELKERLERMLGEPGRDVWASTFHSFCARVLRQEGEALGYSSHFTIYDTDDSRRLMKECMKSLDVEEKTLAHKVILNEIGRAKDELRGPDQYAAEVGADFRLKTVAKCYALYQRRLKEADAMDFDDLMFQAVQLFERNPDVLERWQRRFRYIMVDEYQDTSHAQYRLVSLLAAQNGNLCVVGDDDQSIYKFRGATIENILSFEETFPSSTVIRLEQNYRSTGTVLDAANAVIALNQGRKGKTLWTENPRGDKIHLEVVDNEDEEARFIADTVLNGVAHGRRYSDFAVLYRANAQSNAVERALVKSGVPYRIFGGHRFFDTKEVRDAVAYLRVISNPDDSVSLRRIINEPKRGIGDTTMDAAAAIAEEQGISLYRVLQDADEYAALSRASHKLRDFMNMMESLRDMNDDGEVSLHLLYQTMLEKTGYRAMWELAGEAEAGRVENLKELESSILEYEKNSGDEDATLAGFLEEAALMTDVDNYDTNADTVVLMTMHAAKGLEFPVVFLPGFEDGLFPGNAALFNEEEMEEERRLCYVAITRTEQQLYLLRARSRMLYGNTTRNRESRFISAIPGELLETHESEPTYTRSRFGGSAYGRGYGARGGYDNRGESAVKTYRIEDTQSASAGGYSYSGAAASSSSYAPARPAARATTAAPDWKVGERVRHKTFGDGVIEAAAAMGNDMLLTVKFDTVGQKKIMANFAKLERL